MSASKRGRRNSEICNYHEDKWEKISIYDMITFAGNSGLGTKKFMTQSGENKL